MAKAVYRYRQCPVCRKVMPAGEFGIVNYHGAHWHDKGGSMRRCSGCGYTGFTQDFKVVESDGSAVPGASHGRRVDPDKFIRGKYGHMVHR
jgi:hypothetical protein